MAGRSVSISYIGNASSAVRAAKEVADANEIAAAKTAAAYDTATTKVGRSFSALGRIGANFGIPFNNELGLLGTKLDGTSAKAKKFGSTLGAIGGAEVVAAGAAVAFLGTSSIHAADQFEISHARLVTAVQDTGQQFTSASTAVSKLDNNFIKLGFSSAETENALSILTSATHNVASAQTLMGVSADVARARGKDLGEVAVALTKAAQGNYSSLIRLGIVTKDQTKNFHNLSDVTTYLGKIFGGQAAAFSDTFAGKLAALKAQTTQLEVTLGSALIPKIESVASSTVGAVQGFENANRATDGFLGKAIALTAALPVAVFALEKLGSAGAAIGGKFASAGQALGFGATAAGTSDAAVATAEMTVARDAVTKASIAAGAAEARYQAALLATEEATQGDVAAAAELIAARNAVTAAGERSAAAEAEFGGGVVLAKTGIASLLPELAALVIGVGAVELASKHDGGIRNWLNAHTGGLQLGNLLPGGGGGFGSKGVTGGEGFAQSGAVTAADAEKLGLTVANAQRYFDAYSDAIAHGKSELDAYTSAEVTATHVTGGNTSRIVDYAHGIAGAVAVMGPAEKAQLALSAATHIYAEDVANAHTPTAQLKTDSENVTTAQKNLAAIQAAVTAALDAGNTAASTGKFAWLGLADSVKTAKDAFSQVVSSVTSAASSPYQLQLDTSAAQASALALHGKLDAGTGGGQTAIASALDQQQKELTLRDALLAVGDASRGVVTAEEAVTQAQHDAADATLKLSFAQQNLETVLHGVAAGSQAAKIAIDQYKSAQDAAASSKLDVGQAKRNLEQAKNDRRLLDFAVEDAKRQLAQDRKGKPGTPGVTQFVITPTGSKEIQTGGTPGTGPANSEQIAKDEIALKDAQIAAAGGADTVKRAQIALDEARIAARKNTRDLTEAQRTLNGTLHGYAAGSWEALAAETQLTDAQAMARTATKQLADAQRALITAVNQTTDASLALKRAQADVHGQLTNTKNALGGLINRLDDFRTKSLAVATDVGANVTRATGSVGAGFAAMVDSLQAAVDSEPLLKGAFGSVIQSLRTKIAADLANLKTPPIAVDLLGPSPKAHQGHSAAQYNFDLGGVVPGPVGQPHLAIVHGGETVVPPASLAKSAPFRVNDSTGNTYIFHIGTMIGTEQEAERVIHRALRNLTDKNGSIPGVRVQG